MRIALFGGSFDPVHKGHLAIAKAIIKQTGCDEVWFVLTPASPFKTDRKITSFPHRQAMIELMIKPYRKFKCSTIEKDLAQPSYSIDTLIAAQQKFPGHTFCWVIGSDQALQFDQWKQADQFLRMCPVIVYPREGYSCDDPRFSYLRGTFQKVSSSDIRKGNSRECTPGVLSYMMNHSLYTDEMLSGWVSDKRHQHITTMCACAMDIARCYRLDPERVRCAALMHDACKDADKGIAKQYLIQANPQVALLAPAIWHGPLAAMKLSKSYYVRDKQILRAIWGHVTGSSTSLLGMIIYIADKCDPGRGYDSSAMISLAKKDCAKAFKLVKAQTEQFRKGNNE